jgi:hypothetical protein
VGKLSKEDAESEALATCSRNGAEDCSVDFTYRNQCVAVVSIKGGGAEIQGAATKEKAQKMAMGTCKKTNSSNSCSLLYSECSEPIFRKF